MRKLLKNILETVIKKLEEPETPITDPLDEGAPDAPKGQLEVVEHPQYWVETHYIATPPGNPILSSMTEHAQKKGTVVDVMQNVHRDAVLLMFNCVRSQLKESISFDDGAWRAGVQEGRLLVEVVLHKEETLHRVEEAWQTATQNMRRHGIQIQNYPVNVRRGATPTRATIEVPVINVKLDIDAPLIWMVLRQNINKPILWDKKVWLPKTK